MTPIWRTGYTAHGPSWIEREHDGVLYRAWRRHDGQWAGRAFTVQPFFQPRTPVRWFDDAGEWQCPTLEAMEATIRTAAAARKRLIG